MGLGIMILVLGILYVFVKSRTNNATSPVSAINNATPADTTTTTPAPDTTVPADTTTPAATPTAKKTKASTTPAAQTTITTGAVSSKQIYKGTGKVIPGTGIARDPKSSQNYSMASRHNHASTRYLCWKGHGAGCVPFYNKEVTAYIQVGAVQDSGQRCIVTSGGSGQTANNCCVYSVGFTLAGTPWMEEEGPHSPSPHITKNMAPNTGSIGSIGGKTIGIKLIQWIDSSGSHLEGWVDTGNGSWKQFYKGLNVSGNAKGMQLPVITHIGMQGDSCQEVRIRCDGAWPVTLDQARSSIAEIAVPVQTADGSGVGPSQIQQVPVHTTPTKTKINKVPKVANSTNNKGSGGTVPIGKAGLARYVGSI